MRRTTPPAKSTVLGYLRVSTAGQAESGAGLGAQRQAIDAEATRREWTVSYYEDRGLSAKNLARPQLTEALALLSSGQASTLVVAKLDRLSRSLLDFAGLMERSRREGWSIVALDVGVDTSTPSGELMVNVLASFSHFERRLIGSRTKEALAQKRRDGVQLGRRRELPDEVVATIVDMRVAKRMATNAIADELNRTGAPTAHGGRCWYAATVRAVLASEGLPTGRLGAEARSA